jgi:cytochrome c peroxidase
VLDLANTKAPSLRNLMRPDGVFNGQMMHTGQFKTFEEVLAHYNNIPNVVGNNNLDARLRVGNIGNKLQLTQTEINAVVAFMKTLSGTAVYTDTKWSNPFLVN